MSRHACPRCGLESTYSRDTWADRHPVAAALLALPAGFTLVSVTLAYPWFVVPLLVVLAAWWVDRRNRHRAAIVARAGYEHRELIARAVLTPQPLPVEPPRRLPRPRGADHWSTTQPLPRPKRRAPAHDMGKGRASVFATRQAAGRPAALG